MKCGFACALLLAPASLSAQVHWKPLTPNPTTTAKTAAPAATTPAPAPAAAAPISAPATTNATLRVGTEVPLRLEEELTTKDKQARVGQRFHMTVAEPVTVNGVVVVPVGTPAVGEITDVRNKGMWGKSGHLSARILYMTVNGRQIHLSGTFDDKGVAGGVGAVAVSALVFLPAGFFMTGTSADIPAGSTVKAFVDEDVPLNIAAAAPPPLAVNATAAPMTVPAPAPAQQDQVQVTSVTQVAPTASVKTVPGQPKK
jgi:hypothetical protein